MNAKKAIISTRSKHKKNFSEFPTGNYMNEKLDPQYIGKNIERGSVELIRNNAGQINMKNQTM